MTSQDWITTTTSGVTMASGGGGGYYRHGIHQPPPMLQTTTAMGNPLAGITQVVTNPFSNGINGNWNRLNPAQLARLLREHTFVAMDGTEFCLMCYALDHYRRRIDHDFIIHEE